MKLGGFDLARCCRNFGVGGYGYSHVDYRRLGLRARFLENGASACLPTATHLNVAAASSIRALLELMASCEGVITLSPKFVMLGKPSEMQFYLETWVSSVPPPHINCPQKGLIQGLLQLQLPILATATVRRNDLEHRCFMAVRIVKGLRNGEKCSNLPLLLGNPKPQTLSPKP